MGHTKTAAAAMLAIYASAASADTISATRLYGDALPLSAVIFTTAGPVGDGGSVMPPNLGPRIKGPTNPAPSGRFHPLDPDGTWQDSQDWSDITATFTSPVPFKALIEPANSKHRHEAEASA